MTRPRVACTKNQRATGIKIQYKYLALFNVVSGGGFKAGVNKEVTRPTRDTLVRVFRYPHTKRPFCASP